MAQSTHQSPLAATSHSVRTAKPINRVWEGMVPYLFLAPAIILVGVLLLWPFVRSSYLSFTDFDGLGTPEWVSFSNYQTLFGDSNLSRSLTNTLYWVIGSLLLPVGIGLLIAVLSFDVGGGAVYRIAFLLPYALSGTAIASLWQFILTNEGALNGVLEAIGLESLQRSWLLQPPLNTWAMIIASTWQSVGVSVLLFLIGLQVIPKDPIEAARLDGAEGWRLFWSMTFPLLRPMTVVIVGISLVNSLKTFDVIWVMTQGGPYRSSETLAVTMYRETFVLFRHGYGAAIAVVLSLIVVAVSWVYLQRSMRHG